VDVGNCNYYPSNATIESTDARPGITYRQHLIETVLSALIVRYDPLSGPFMPDTIALEAIAIVDAVLKIENNKQNQGETS
jgi:hypothetical protein